MQKLLIFQAPYFYNVPLKTETKFIHFSYFIYIYIYFKTTELCLNLEIEIYAFLKYHRKKQVAAHHRKARTMNSSIQVAYMIHDVQMNPCS
jgi:hypothetical protein